MKPGTAANIVHAALLALAAFEFSRVTSSLDALQARVQQHDVQLARLEVRSGQ